MTPDQQALVELAADIMGTAAPDQLWSRLVEAGLLGIAVPEEAGGAGLGVEEVLLLLEEQGRQVAAVPLWESLVATLALGAAPEQPFALAVSLDGGQPLVSACAERVVGVDDSGAFVCDLPEGEDVITTDHTPAVDVDLSECLKQRLDVDPTWLLDVARLGLCAQQLGNVEGGVREAARHLTGREQFGRPLATFQATTQQLGDAYCDVQAMRATLWQACWALSQGPARREVDVACWWATDAGERAQHTVQHLHGGLGADITYPVHRRLLLTMRINAFLGGSSRQLVRLGQSVATA